MSDRPVTISDLQKLADQQAENFAKLKLDLNATLAFLQLLLNLQTHQLAEKFEVPFHEMQNDLSQTLVKIKSNIDQAGLETAKLFDELNQRKKAN